MNTREAMLATIRGESTQKLIFAPRLDLWYPARLARGDMPDEYKGLNMEEISEKEGWTPYRVMPDLTDLKSADDLIHRGLGIISNKFDLCRYEIDGNVKFHINTQEDGNGVTYKTPLGEINVRCSLPENQRKNGITCPLVTHHAINSVDDYKIVAYIFENLRPIPDYESFLSLEKRLGDKTLCFAAGSMAASPMHQILRDFIDPTQFYLHYKDYPEQIQALSKSMEDYFKRLIDVIAKSPATGVVWGANFDDMLTYPDFFEKEIMPWLSYACDKFHAHGKIVASHTDGENTGLMNLIKKSGIDVADSVCPFPMGKMPIAEYYKNWGSDLTILGGIPQDFLLPNSTSLTDLNQYLDHFFSDITPGYRFIAGIADAVPPDADFDRLKHIGEKVQELGQLPLSAGGFNPVSPTAFSHQNDSNFQDYIKELSQLFEPYEKQLGPLMIDLSKWMEKTGKNWRTFQGRLCLYTGSVNGSSCHEQWCSLS